MPAAAVAATEVAVGAMLVVLEAVACREAALS
jgi:hypothetical protein